MLNTRRFPQTATTRFADWPDTLRAAVSPEYLEPGVVNLCHCRVNPGGTITLRTHCLRSSPSITIPARLATVTAPDTASAAEPSPEPTCQFSGAATALEPPTSIDNFLEGLPS